MLNSIELPKELLINSNKVKNAGHEKTGELIFEVIKKRLNLQSFSDIDVLDVGCGTRFTMTLINKRIPIKSYTGLEINKKIVDFFQENVTPFDDRFEYHHWDVYNDMYNTQGQSMQSYTDLPVEKKFDVIWLFSVFTHLNPDDAKTLLTLMRKRIRPNGKLFFTTHTNDHIEQFEDKIEEKPLLRAFFNKEYLQSLIQEAGWKVDSFNPKDGDHYVKSHFVCSPID